jgi:L-aspartate oxidase
MKPVIIGAGLAGLTVALSLVPMPVILLSPRKLGAECASAWAQGGIAAAVGNNDTTALHAEDTLKAAAGLGDADIVRQVTEDGAKIIEHLTHHGVAFDRDATGQLCLGLEGAHSRRRIVHAADHTGAAIMNALIAASCATPSIEIIEDAVATNLLTNENAITGVRIERNGACSTLATNRVVLATGGAGALWKHTTNPLDSWGRGLALAARAGAALGDLEFMQFHPTVIDIGRDLPARSRGFASAEAGPMPLASEALRGEGCTLVDEQGYRFTDELQPRDIVARAIANHICAGHKVFLDARAALGDKFAARFPSIHALCASAGIDPARVPIPVRPAAHYHMGGVVTDAHGRTNVEGLWACGEVACTGFHGANRLASNSLLEAASFGNRVAGDILGVRGSGFGVSKELNFPIPNPQPPTPYIRSIMSAHLGLTRVRMGLETAITQLAPHIAQSDMALAAWMIAAFAVRRDESRGAHARADFPDASRAWAHRQILTLAEISNLTESHIDSSSSRKVACNN